MSDVLRNYGHIKDVPVQSPMRPQSLLEVPQLKNGDRESLGRAQDPLRRLQHRAALQSKRSGRLHPADFFNVLRTVVITYLTKSGCSLGESVEICVPATQGREDLLYTLRQWQVSLPRMLF